LNLKKDEKRSILFRKEEVFDFFTKKVLKCTQHLHDWVSMYGIQHRNKLANETEIKLSNGLKNVTSYITWRRVKHSLGTHNIILVFCANFVLVDKENKFFKIALSFVKIHSNFKIQSNKVSAKKHKTTKLYKNYPALRPLKSPNNLWLISYISAANKNWASTCNLDYFRDHNDYIQLSNRLEKLRKYNWLQKFVRDSGKILVLQCRILNWILRKIYRDKKCLYYLILNDLSKISLKAFEIIIQPAFSINKLEFQNLVKYDRFAIVESYFDLQLLNKSKITKFERHESSIFLQNSMYLLLKVNYKSLLSIEMIEFDEARIPGCNSTYLLIFRSLANFRIVQILINIQNFRCMLITQLCILFLPEAG